MISLENFLPEESPYGSRIRNVLKRTSTWLARYKWLVVGAVAVLAILILGPVVLMHVTTADSRFAAGDVGSVPDRQVGIVFGAGVLPGRKPTPYLQRRLDSAVDLYKAGKVSVLLLSGDNSASNHNEPIAMQQYVVEQGVKKADTVLDYAGFNTYDSCYRAKAIFGVKEAIIVSQSYHLPRAMWTCSSLGVKSIGVAAKVADGRDYTFNYLLREIVSSDKALLQIIFKPRPTVLGDAEPIIISR